MINDQSSVRFLLFNKKYEFFYCLHERIIWRTKTFVIIHEQTLRLFLIDFVMRNKYLEKEGVYNFPLSHTRNI